MSFFKNFRRPGIAIATLGMTAASTAPALSASPILKHQVLATLYKGDQPNEIFIKGSAQEAMNLYYANNNLQTAKENACEQNIKAVKNLEPAYKNYYINNCKVKYPPLQITVSSSLSPKAPISVTFTPIGLQELPVSRKITAAPNQETKCPKDMTYIAPKSSQRYGQCTVTYIP